MSNAFGIDISALQAFQQAIAVTSNNVANASTPGYDEESIELGGGRAADVGRRADRGRRRRQRRDARLQPSGGQPAQHLAEQPGPAQRAAELHQPDRQLVRHHGGRPDLGAADLLQRMVDGRERSDLDRRASGAARRCAAPWRRTSRPRAPSSTRSIRTSTRASPPTCSRSTRSAPRSPSSTSRSSAHRQGAGQTPNHLLDQRDQLVSNLSQLVGVTTTTDTQRRGQRLHRHRPAAGPASATTDADDVPNQFNASQLEVSSSTSNGNSISNQITSGDLGGLLAARTQAINPALNQLGQIATVIAQSANTQQGSGLDLNGQFGANLFSVGGPTATASSANTDNTTATVSIANIGQLTSDNYILTYNGGAYSLTDATTGASVALTGAGTAANPLQAARLVDRAVRDPRLGRSVPDSADGPGGRNARASRSPTPPASPRRAPSRLPPPIPTPERRPSAPARWSMPRTRICLTTTTIKFLTPTTYSVNGAGSFAYTTGGQHLAQRLAGRDQRHAGRGRCLHRAEQCGPAAGTTPMPSPPPISSRRASFRTARSASAAP